MVLAAYGYSRAYEVVLVLHILAVVVGFGGLFLAPMLRRTEASPASVASAVLRYVQVIAVPAVALAGVLGMGLLGMSKVGDSARWKFSQGWVGAAILLWIVELAILWFGVAGTEKKVVAGDAAAESRLAMFTGISQQLLLVLVGLMVFKPGT